MATRKDLKQKLINALILELKKVDKAMIDYVNQSEIQISDVVSINPVIVSPEDIDKDNYKEATAIYFERAQIRIIRLREGLIYYCDGNAKIVYENDAFTVCLNGLSIKSS